MEAPAHYQRALAQAGGRNPYGEPRFRLQWGEELIRRRGVPDELVAHRKMPCWVLCEWRPASDYPPNAWPEGLPYPSSGRYEIVQIFREESGAPVPIDSDALNVRWLLMMVRLAMEHRLTGIAAHFRQFREMQQEEKRRQCDRIADVLHDSLPAFRDVASYARNHGTRTAVQKKMDQIEQNIKRGLPVLTNPRGRGQVRADYP